MAASQAACTVGHEYFVSYLLQWMIWYQSVQKPFQSFVLWLFFRAWSLNWMHRVEIVLILLFCLVISWCCGLYYSLANSSSSLFNFLENVPGNNHPSSSLIPVLSCQWLTQPLSLFWTCNFNRNAKGSEPALMTKCIENHGVNILERSWELASEKLLKPSRNMANL